MAKILSKTGISTLQIVRPWHVTQSIDAFLGTDAYDITLSGSMTITGSVLLNGLSTTSQTNVITYDTTSGQLFYTASSAVGGGSINTGSLGNTTISGSLTVTGSTTLIGNTTVSGSITSTGGFTGSLNGTASWAQNVVGGGASVAGNNYEIQFNSASAFQANSNFKFNYLSQSLEQGTSVTAKGEYSHAEGLATNASGAYSHTEGASTFAAGTVDHAEGYQTTASSVGWPPGGGAAAAAHAEGYNTIAYGIASHAEGYATLVSNSFSHAEGYGTIANGTASHAEGFLTTASGDYSHAAGYGTHATGSGIGQSVIGWFNEPVTGHGDFIIGNGTSDSSRSNLLHASGNLVTITGIISASSYVGSITSAATASVVEVANILQNNYYELLISDDSSWAGSPTTSTVNKNNKLSFNPNDSHGWLRISGSDGSFNYIGNGQITASSDISSSGTVTAEFISASSDLLVEGANFKMSNDSAVVKFKDKKVAERDPLLGNTAFGDTSIGTIIQGNFISFTNPVTASADISSSAALTVNGNVTTNGTFIGDGSTLTNLQRPISNSVQTSFTASNINSGFYFRAGGNVTCSLKVNATASCDVGNEFEIFQTSSDGYVLIEADPGVTLNSKGGNTKLAGQFSGATLKKVGTDEWDLIGDLG